MERHGSGTRARLGRGELLSAHCASRGAAISIAVLGRLTTALLIYRVLLDLPAPDQVVDQKLGAFVGWRARSASRSEGTNRPAAD